MSKDSIIANFIRVATNMFTQFNTDEPLISKETQEILNDPKGRKEISEKIVQHPRQGGEVKVHFEGKEITYFVEA